MSDEKSFALYGDWVLVHRTLPPNSAIMDSDGNVIYDTYRLVTVEEAEAYCRGFEYGFARGKATGELDAKTAIRKAIGL